MRAALEAMALMPVTKVAVAEVLPVRTVSVEPAPDRQVEREIMAPAALAVVREGAMQTVAAAGLEETMLRLERPVVFRAEVAAAEKAMEPMAAVGSAR